MFSIYISFIHCYIDFIVNQKRIDENQIVCLKFDWFYLLWTVFNQKKDFLSLDILN